MPKRIDVLDKTNSENVFAYYDLTNEINIDIEKVLSKLSRLKGFVNDSDKGKIQTSRNQLIRVQDKMDKLRKRLQKSNSWFMRK